MEKWKAITESGAVYVYNRGHLRYKGSHGEMTFKPLVLRFFEANMDFLAKRKHDESDYELITRLGEKEPRVGLNIYASSFDLWRVSTPIISLEDFS